MLSVSKSPFLINCPGIGVGVFLGIPDDARVDNDDRTLDIGVEARVDELVLETERTTVLETVVRDERREEDDEGLVEELVRIELACVELALVEVGLVELETRGTLLEDAAPEQVPNADRQPLET